MYVSPTVQTGYRGREALLERSRDSQLGSVAKQQLEALQAKCESQLEFLRRLWSEWDIKIVSRDRCYPDIRRLLPGPGTSEPRWHEQHGGHKVGHKWRAKAIGWTTGLAP